MELGDIADQVRQGLLDLAALIQGLGAGQIKGLVQFVNPVSGPNMSLQFGLLMTLIKGMLPDQMEQFINESVRIDRLFIDVPTPSASASSSSGFAGADHGPNNPGADSDKSEQEQFAVLYQLWQLQDVLRSLTITQLTKIIEILPQTSRFEQIRQLEQLQQLLTQLLPEFLASLQQDLAQLPPDQIMTTLVQLVTLDGEHFHLYKSLRHLLQMDLPELISLREALPRFSLTQLVLLTRLVEVGVWDSFDLQRILASTASEESAVVRGPLAHTMHLTRTPSDVPFNSPNSSSSFGAKMDPLAIALNAQPFGGTDAMDEDDGDDEMEPYDYLSSPVFRLRLAYNYIRSCHCSEHGLRLEIVEQPPEKCVYKRNIKPAPTIMVVGDNSSDSRGSLFVFVSLLRCDTGEAQAQLITGNKPTEVTSGRVIPFKRLKILVTSHQMNETLFSLRFELRRYADARSAERGAPDFELLGSATSNPICVLSHSTQLKPTSSVNPVVLEVIPMSGPTTGLTRVAVLGANFVESPTTRVKFDNIEVMPIFHGPKTLICVTPKHAAGTVDVRVCNDPKRWSDSAGKFTYDAALVVEEDHSTNAGEHGLKQDPRQGQGWHAAFEGGFETARVLQENGGIPGAASLPPTQQHTLANQLRAAAHKLDERGYSTLHYAAAWGMTELLFWLLQTLRCDPVHRDRRGNTTLHWAVFANQLTTVQALSTSFNALVNIPNADGQTPLHVALCSRDNDPIIAALVSSGANLNSRDIDGLSALHLAAWSGRPGVVAHLAQTGAFVNQQDNEGDTPLHWAVRKNDSKMIELLIHHCGADASIRNADQETPLYLAAAIGTSFGSASAGALLAAGCELAGEEARSLLVSSTDSSTDEEMSSDEPCIESSSPVSCSSCFHHPALMSKSYAHTGAAIYL